LDDGAEAIHEDQVEHSVSNKFGMLQ